MGKERRDADGGRSQQQTHEFFAMASAPYATWFLRENYQAQSYQLPSRNYLVLSFSVPQATNLATSPIDEYKNPMDSRDEQGASSRMAIPLSKFLSQMGKTYARA